MNIRNERVLLLCAFLPSSQAQTHLPEQIERTSTHKHAESRSRSRESEKAEDRMNRVHICVWHTGMLALSKSPGMRCKHTAHSAQYMHTTSRTYHHIYAIYVDCYEFTPWNEIEKWKQMWSTREREREQQHTKEVENKTICNTLLISTGNRHDISRILSVLCLSQLQMHKFTRKRRNIFMFCAENVPTCAFLAAKTAAAAAVAVAVATAAICQTYIVATAFCATDDNAKCATTGQHALHRMTFVQFHPVSPVRIANEWMNKSDRHLWVWVCYQVRDGM